MNNSLIEALVKEDEQLLTLPPELLAQSQNPTAGGYAWGEFYRYRATIRALLRQGCTRHGIKIGTHEGLQDMAKYLQDQGVLKEKLVADIDLIGEATYTAQWGAGNPPTHPQALFVATDTPRVIKEVSDQLKTH